jgi:predicted RNase H-like HicB family nuclease
VEIPEANGQGRTIKECRQSLVEAIKLVIEDRKVEVIKSLPKDVIKEEVKVA